MCLKGGMRQCVNGSITKICLIDTHDSAFSHKNVGRRTRLNSSARHKKIRVEYAAYKLSSENNRAEFAGPHVASILSNLNCSPPERCSYSIRMNGVRIPLPAARHSKFGQHKIDGAHQEIQ